MSAIDNLRAIARGIRPANDGLLGNARCAWGQADIVSEEAILAAFTARPFDLEGDLLEVETKQGAALIGANGALVADVYDGRIGRLWHVGPTITAPAAPHVDVAFDPDMRQERGGLNFRAEDHPELHASAVEPILEAARSLAEKLRAEGRLRVRAFVVRAFGTQDASAALLFIHTLGNEERRSATFSYAVIGSGAQAKGKRIISEPPAPREWTPRL